MRILFDQGVPRGLTASLRDHEVTEARKLKWEGISNGELLKLTEGAGFDLLVTTDKNMRYEQNLANRKISIVVLGNSPWRLVRRHLVEVVTAVNAPGRAATSRSIYRSSEIRRVWNGAGGYCFMIRIVNSPLPPAASLTIRTFPPQPTALRFRMLLALSANGRTTNPSPHSRRTRRRRRLR
jgi:hypothetical protein